MDDFLYTVDYQRFLFFLTLLSTSSMLILCLVSRLNFSHWRTNRLILQDCIDLLIFSLVNNLLNLLLYLLKMNLFLVMLFLLDFLLLFYSSEYFDRIFKLLIDLRWQRLGVRKDLFKLNYFSISYGKPFFPVITFIKTFSNGPIRQDVNPFIILLTLIPVA